MAEELPDGWLSTRNKRKIPAVSVPKSKRHKSLVPRRPVGFSSPSTCFTFTQNTPPPPELFTHTRQTSINNFFRPRNGVKIQDGPSENPVEFSTDIGDLNFTCMYEDNSEYTESYSSTKDPSPLENSEKGSNPDSSFEEKRLELTDIDSDQRIVLSEIVNIDFDATERKTGGKNFHVEQELTGAKENLDRFQNSVLMSSSSQRCIKTNYDFEKNTLSDCESQLENTLKLCASRKNDISKLDKNLTVDPSLFSQRTSEIELLESSGSSGLIEKQCEISGDWPTTLGDSSEYVLYAGTENTLDSFSFEMSQKAATKSNVDNFSEPFTFAFLSQDPTLRTRGITSVGLLGTVKGGNSVLPLNDNISLTETDTELNTTNSPICDVDLILDSQTILSDNSMCGLSDSELI